MFSVCAPSLLSASAGIMPVVAIDNMVEVHKVRMRAVSERRMQVLVCRTGNGLHSDAWFVVVLVFVVIVLVLLLFIDLVLAFDFVSVLVHHA